MADQKTDYYPFGLAYSYNATDKNRYLYNGKELQDQAIGGTPFGWYDYGARFYDPELGRWHSVDPLCELSRRWSPYTYAYDNAIVFTDPDGMKANRFNINEPNYEPGDARDDYVWDPRRKKNEDLSPFNEGDNRENKRDDIPSLIPGNDYGFVDELEMYQNFKVVKSERKKGGQTSNTNITVSANGPLFAIGSSINIASYLESIMAGGGSIITSSALSAGLLIFSFIGLTGDTNEIDEYVAPPRDLKGFPGSVREKRKGGRTRWRLPNGDIAEWDSQHGEVEVYDKTGKKHKGALNPETGEKKKEPEKGRKTNN